MLIIITSKWSEGLKLPCKMRKLDLHVQGDKKNGTPREIAITLILSQQGKWNKNDTHRLIMAFQQLKQLFSNKIFNFSETKIVNTCFRIRIYVVNTVTYISSRQVTICYVFFFMTCYVFHDDTLRWVTCFVKKSYGFLHDLLWHDTTNYVFCYDALPFSWYVTYIHTLRYVTCLITINNRSARTAKIGS